MKRSKTLLKRDFYQVISLTLTYRSAVAVRVSYLLSCKLCLFPECKEYRILQAPDRSIHHPYTPSAPCDISLKPSWYRFEGRAGTAMANSCPSRFKCGTIVPGWLNGPLPSVQDGIVSRKICFNQDRDCCFTSTQAKVRNCAGFYVFYLRSAPYCQLRYCGNGRIVSYNIDQFVYWFFFFFPRVTFSLISFESLYLLMFVEVFCQM